MAKMLEYAAMKWDDPTWIDPVSEAVIAILVAHPNRVFSTDQLLRALGVSGLRNAKAVQSMRGKLAALRKEGEPLCDYWAHSLTRFSPFKNKITGARMAAIDWRAPSQSDEPMHDVERLEKIKVSLAQAGLSAGEIEALTAKLK